MGRGAAPSHPRDGVHLPGVRVDSLAMPVGHPTAATKVEAKNAADSSRKIYQLPSGSLSSISQIIAQSSSSQPAKTQRKKPEAVRV